MPPKKKAKKATAKKAAGKKKEPPFEAGPMPLAPRVLQPVDFTFQNPQMSNSLL